MRILVGKVFFMNNAFIGLLAFYLQPACSLFPNGIANRIVSLFKKSHQIAGIKSCISQKAQLAHFASRTPVRNYFEDFIHDRFGFIGRKRLSRMQPGAYKSAGIVFLDDQRLISRLLLVRNPGRSLLIATGLGF